MMYVQLILKRPVGTINKNNNTAIISKVQEMIIPS